MSRREVIDCDRCPEKLISDPITVWVVVGYTPCAAGGRSEADNRRLDLCHKCAAKLLGDAVSKLPEDEAMKWYKKATERIKK